MKIVVKLIDDLIPYENNAKLHPQEQIEQIKNSIQEFGNNDPIAIDENNVIIEGHGRYEALKELGYKETEVIILDGLNEEQKNAYRLVHNQLTMNTDWDIEKLKNELDTIDIDMSDLGFDDSLFDGMIEEKEVHEDNFDVDEAIPEIPTTTTGQVWKLGNHRLMCGDSTQKEAVMRLMNNQEADMLLTDPPYNVDYEGTAGKIQNDNMSNDDFRTFLVNAFNQANNVMKQGATFYIWHADSEGHNFRGACQDIGWKVRQCLIWCKNSLVMGRQDYQWKHEPCLYGWKDGASHNWYSDRSQTTILEFNKPNKSEEHPTMKPIELFGYQIKNSSKENDIILDLFGGSGTTLIACEQLNRKCFMMELDPKYCDVIIKRWETLTGKKALLIE